MCPPEALVCNRLHCRGRLAPSDPILPHDLFSFNSMIGFNTTREKEPLHSLNHCTNNLALYEFRFIPQVFLDAGRLPSIFRGLHSYFIPISPTPTLLVVIPS